MSIRKKYHLYLLYGSRQYHRLFFIKDIDSEVVVDIYSDIPVVH